MGCRVRVRATSLCLKVNKYTDPQGPNTNPKSKPEKKRITSLPNKALQPQDPRGINIQTKPNIVTKHIYLERVRCSDLSESVVRDK